MKKHSSLRGPRRSDGKPIRHFRHGPKREGAAEGEAKPFRPFRDKKHQGGGGPRPFRSDRPKRDDAGEGEAKPFRSFRDKKPPGGGGPRPFRSDRPKRDDAGEGEAKPFRSFRDKRHEGGGDRRSFRPHQPKQKEDKNSGKHLFGFHAVSNAWMNPKRKVLRLLVTVSGKKQMESAMQRAKAAGLKRPVEEVVEGHVIDKLLPRGAVHQGLMLMSEELPEEHFDDLLKEQGEALLVVLDQVTDPHNVGAVLRSACAFGARAVLMTDRHAATSTGTLAKSASGALEHMPLVRIPNLAQGLSDLQKAGYWCIGLDESGKQALHEIKMPEKVALVLGAEGDGLRRLTRESCDEIAKLPTGGPIGSLNVSNAAAVAIYEAFRQKN
jgi:23S rRNA (guanosine2251-2'-O)-methyltransferase